MRVDVTATDPHGASVSGHFIAEVQTLNDTNGAPFLANPGPQRFAHNQTIQPLVLPNYLMYVTARGATNALTMSLAQELGRDNIQVNAVAPNYVESPT